MTPGPAINPVVWQRKATAFVVRSHRHLWGKNNEDPLSFLFKQGLKNQFARDQYLGWNKFGQERPLDTWGFDKPCGRPDKFLLPAGIVIPFIRDKQLISVFILPFLQPKSAATVIPGSQSTILYLEGPGKTIYIIQDIMDGLLLFQEKGDTVNVMVLADPGRPLEPGYITLIKQADHIRVYVKDKQGMPPVLSHLDHLSSDSLISYTDAAGLLKTPGI